MKIEIFEDLSPVAGLMRKARNNGQDTNLLDRVARRIRNSNLAAHAEYVEGINYLLAKDHMNRSKITGKRQSMDAYTSCQYCDAETGQCSQICNTRDKVDLLNRRYDLLLILLKGDPNNVDYIVELEQLQKQINTLTYGTGDLY